MAMLDSNSDSQNPVEKDEVSFSLAPKDRAAMATVLGDFEKSETWLSSKQWALRWRESQLRYEPIRKFRYLGGHRPSPIAQPECLLGGPGVAGHQRQSHRTKLCDNHQFNTQPHKGTDAEEAQAMGTLLHFQTEDCDFRREIDERRGRRCAVRNFDLESLTGKKPTEGNGAPSLQAQGGAEEGRSSYPWC